MFLWHGLGCYSFSCLIIVLRACTCHDACVYMWGNKEGIHMPWCKYVMMGVGGIHVPRCMCAEVRG